MGSFSDYAELKILGHAVGKTSWTMPTVYLGLSTADPTDSGVGLAEPSGNGYARVATSGATWNTPSEGAVDNAAEIAFPQATGSWGTITHFALFDAASAGNMIAHGALTVAKSVSSGDTVKVAAGDLDITQD